MINAHLKRRFMQEFESECLSLPGIQRVEFFGSFNTDNWKHGISDIDISIYGENISGDTKYQVIQILRRLNNKYGLMLENVRCAHPTPFFLDSPVRIQLFQQLMKGHSEIIELGRNFMKQNAHTYRDVWASEDSVKVFENALPVPRFSELFDKFR
ncbi:MAG: nucleotidyltransferase domain-containing protein [Candidatus Methanoperedens sp.]|nr:nucleotidyltransferase domain-containing protein [Candidatus Methanoperedens sp.]